MTDQQNEQYQEALFARADQILDGWLKTEPFSEGLTNAAVAQAEREVPKPA